MKTALIEGNIKKQLINFAWPAFISSIFSELYNVTNAIIVGNYVSLEALSAISACTWICNIFNFTFYGLGMGAGILVAKYYGANDKDNIKKTMDTSIIFAVVGGIILTIISELCLPLLMKACNIGPDIYQSSYEYLKVYLLGNTAVLTSHMCFFMLRSFGETKHQLYYSIISSIINITIGLILVRVFKMNVVGTAIATIVSQFVMDVLALKLLSSYYDTGSFNIKNMDFSFPIVGEICSLGIPAGIQNMLIAISSMLVQSYVNTFSNEVIAGVGVAEKVAGWTQMASLAISSGTMAMVAQNYGAKKYDRVRQVIKDSLLLGTIFTLISVIIIFMFARLIVSGFNDNSLVIKHGTEMTRIIAISSLLINLSHVYNAACRGSGNVKYPMFIAIFGQVICKFLFVYIGLKISYDVHILYFGSAVGYSVAGILATLYFNFSKWTKDNGLRT